MTDIEFLLSLYGILLGFSLAEVLGGLARLVEARKSADSGKLLFGALGILLLVDVALFWSWMWDIREHVTVTVGTILFGLVVASFYYVAAYLAFPRVITSGTKLNRHFSDIKWWVLGPILAANALTLVGVLLLTRGRTWSAADYASEMIYFALVASALWPKNPKYVTTLLAGAIVVCVAYVVLVEF